MESVDLSFPLPGGWLAGRNLKRELVSVVMDGRKVDLIASSSSSSSSSSSFLKRGGDWTPALPCLSLLLHLARGLGESQSKMDSSHTF